MIFFIYMTMWENFIADLIISFCLHKTVLTWLKVSSDRNKSNVNKGQLLFARAVSRGRRFNRSIRRPQAVRTLTSARINSAHAVVKLHSEQPQWIKDGTVKLNRVALRKWDVRLLLSLRGNFLYTIKISILIFNLLYNYWDNLITKSIGRTSAH